MCLDPVSLFFRDNGPFFDPLDIFPSFELDHDFIGIHIFLQVKIDLPVDGFAGEVEILVDFDKDL